MLDSVIVNWAIVSIIAYWFYSLLSSYTLLRSIPGPKIFAITRWRLALEDWRGARTRTINQLHEVYGPVVRVGPREISFNSLGALKSIYGAGSGFERTAFYRMFDAYGEQNLFTFASPKAHGERKKLLNHAYSRSSILKNSAAAVQEKTWQFLDLLEREPLEGSEIFRSLHYYSLDNITHFLYGDEFGGTNSMQGSLEHRRLLDDVLDPARRHLSWFAVHFPRYTKWLMTRTGFLERTINTLGLLPQQKPTVYTGIRRHALEAWEKFSGVENEKQGAASSSTIIGKLWQSHISQKGEGQGLRDMEIASEAADHLLAGIDTTSDTLMFFIWALSLPQNQHFQQKLVEEVSSMDASDLDHRGIPTADATGKLSYLDAVIKETLRLYAPLPAAEPRSLPVDSVIDGYRIPAETVVIMSPYSLHRNAEVFPDPLRFDPERWLRPSEDTALMKKWFWAFSSGGRMCIGLHLAMAEMTTLAAAIYRVYHTNIQNGFEDTSPGITSRFEVFSDETMPKMKVFPRPNSK
ncbi:benzoate 4-monooxygenase cytochrome P450 [Phlyctema vagabunda]|uniref:Benzoate 4-monooxygenase cytochrome P450 n=1 Tax=Phlyctema vagabunda TaxID=108571 RepID=A0ABR4P1N9_9HELO